RLETTPGRLDKLALVADFLGRLEIDETPTAVAYLTGRPFPSSDPRVLGVRGLPRTSPAERTSLTLSDVAEGFADVAGAAGAGSRRARGAPPARAAPRGAAGEPGLPPPVLHRGVGAGLAPP